MRQTPFYHILNLHITSYIERKSFAVIKLDIRKGRCNFLFLIVRQHYYLQRDLQYLITNMLFYNFI